MGIQKAVFLDRDGTLNKVWTSPDGVTHPPSKAVETVLVPEAVEACSILRRMGYRLFCVTNQPDVARGTQRLEIVQAINNLVASQLRIEEVFTCVHDNEDQCECRKPKPGLILRAAEKHRICLLTSYMIGDRMSDVLAGEAAGCRSILIEDRSPNGSNGNRRRAASLMGAVRWIQVDQLLRGGSNV
jgi:D-glycero-D-manno-heptose 1,7-bisphosphate phosphatase